LDDRDSVSIREMRPPRHWLGRQDSPGGETLPDRAWNQRDEPTDREERAA
jgi:hypothetical protein